jgi:hypothetical protein
MFGRKGDSKPVANRLRNEAKPNTLSWTEPVEADEEFEQDDELEPNQLASEDDDPEEADDSEAIARRKADLDAELQRQAEEFGLTRSDPVLQFGPNGEEVADMLDRLASIDMESAERVADAWEAVPEEERSVVDLVLRRRHRNGKLSSEIWAAEQAVAGWLATRDPADDDEKALFEVVAAAATDAATALVLEDELQEVDFATLYDPWGEVMDGDDADGSGTAIPEADPMGGWTPDQAPAEVQENDGEFGPNSDVVYEFLGRLDSLPPAMVEQLVRAWQAADPGPLETAHRNLAEAVRENDDWRDQAKAAQERVVDWVNEIKPPGNEWGRMPAASRLRQSAGPVLADAVAALALADILTAEDAAALYGSWASVVGLPALPVFEDDEAE